MGIDVIENVFMLLAAVIGLLLTLFRYIETPKRGFLYISIFFLTHLLSDYYWTTYSIIMGDEPAVSGFMAYFGWNLGYMVLFFAALEMRSEKAKRFFSPLMLLPIPINLIQFFIYIQYGGIINNIWEGFFATAIAVVSLQSILCYVKNRDDKSLFPWIHNTFLFFIMMEYGMWTSSCYSWPSPAANPYYYCAFAESMTLLFFSWASRKDYEAKGEPLHEKTADELRSQIVLQVLVTAITIVGYVGGFAVARIMKTMMPKGNDSDSYDIIALTLFGISLILLVLVLLVVVMAVRRYRVIVKNMSHETARKRSRVNLLFTVFITLSLMIFSVAYTSRLFYRVSVTGLLEDGEAKTESTATELDNYLGVARSILWVTADTVDLMLENGESQETIRKYLVDQTTNQSEQFDENFTGLYAYINGEYLDGSEWEPPEGYNAEERDWYKAAVDAKGETIIVNPYVDAQSHSVVITICKLIDHREDESYDNRQVVALDLVVNHVQSVTEQVQIGGKGYGMVVDEKGMIVAHSNPKQNGNNVEDVFGTNFMASIIEAENRYSTVLIKGDEYTIFSAKVIEDWYVVIAVGKSELLEEVQSQLWINIIVSLIIFLLISFFYYLGYKNEQVNSKKVEELKISRQKHEYEARELKQKKLAADEANKAKSRFLADMSHEIRTPINAILGMNEMVLRESYNEDVLEYARNIRVSGKSLLQLINSILDFSKIEDGKMEIVPVTYNMSSVIAYLLSSIQERANEKHLDLVFDIDPNLPSKLYGDDSRINQVVMNLLTNAVKYTPEGSVKLTIKDQCRYDDNILIYVEVKDTGIGIREEDMDKLFESFGRLDHQKNRNIEGTGLGMSIITNILKLMDSGIKVESEYGKGSVFSFEIWQKIEDKTPLGDYKVAMEEKDDDEVFMGLLWAPEAKILIVDDTRMNLLVATSLLKRTEIQMDTALNGEDALVMVKEKDYDVILLDQRMPGMDGTQTLAEIRKLGGHNAEVPVICLTADAIRGARERLMKEGFTDYLSKPVDGKSLEMMLITYLPKELVRDISDKKESQEVKAPIKDDTLMSKLEAVGIQTDYGLSMCLDDEEMFKQILAAYAGEHEERSKKIIEYYNAKDWENYNIYVHSLKSTSKSIGAMQLSILAAGLEKASGEGDVEKIDADHNTALELYERIATAISECEEIDTESDDDDDMVMFEF